MAFSEEPRFFGWYSQLQQTENGHCHYYRLSTGEVVKVTSVSSSVSRRPCYYPDMFMVGEIRQHIETVPNGFFNFVHFKVSQLFGW